MIGIGYFSSVFYGARIKSHILTGLYHLGIHSGLTAELLVPQTSACPKSSVLRVNWKEAGTVTCGDWSCIATGSFSLVSRRASGQTFLKNTYLHCKLSDVAGKGWLWRRPKFHWPGPWLVTHSCAVGGAVCRFKLATICPSHYGRRRWLNQKWQRPSYDGDCYRWVTSCLNQSTYTIVY